MISTQEVLTGTVVSLITFVFTYLGMSIVQKNETKTTVKEHMEEHEKIHHKEDVYLIVDRHAKECFAPESIRMLREEMGTIKGALMFLVVKMDGNPKDLGLVK